MSDSFDVPDGVDTETPSVARVYDYFLGGGSNFKADREFAQRILTVLPGARSQAVINRQWQHRAVRWVAEQGVRQFLDLGAGIPTVNPTHEVARRVHPDAKVVYVDDEPVAVTHGRAQLEGNPGTLMVHAKLQDTGQVLAAAAKVLDFTEPVAVVMAAILHVVSDDDDPKGIVARYRAATVPGSYLLLSHVTAEGDLTDEIGDVEREYSHAPISTFHPRSTAQVADIVAGYQLVEPGIVRGSQWRPGEGDEPADGHDVFLSVVGTRV